MSPTISPEERALQAQVFAGPQPQPEPVKHETATVLFTGLEPEKPPKRNGNPFNQYIPKPPKRPIGRPPKAKPEEPEQDISTEPEPVTEGGKALKQAWLDKQKASEQPEPAQPKALDWTSLIEQLQAARAMCGRFDELASEMINLVQGRTQ